MTSEEVIEALSARRGERLYVHLIGVAGSGMSGLAALCLALGHRVSGSDRVRSGEIDRLEELGLEFTTPHRADLAEGRDAVIYSSAVRAGNPVWDAAEGAGVPLVRRAEALAGLLRAKRGIVVAGTHGKTTTSALAAHVLRGGGLHPSHYVGAEVPLLGSNAFWDPDGEWLVAEGDESDGSLLRLAAEHALVLNVEEDHVDFFHGIEEVWALFGEFVARVPGWTIYCGEDAGARRICGERARQPLSYGWNPEEDYAAAVVKAEANQTEFTVLRRGEILGRVELSIPGRHNVLNALAVIALATELGVPFGAVAEALGTFRGARRRFERKYVGARYTVVDDYGHHPTEVEATLRTALGLQASRLVVVFQPHRYSRTRRFAREFGRVLGLGDRVFVAEVYPAGEERLPDDGAEAVVESFRSDHPEGRIDFLSEKRTAHWVVGNALRPGDLLITLGAGDVHVLGSRLARDLEVMEALAELMGGEGGGVRLYEPMSRHTTLRVGGPAQYWLEPATFAAFARAVSYARANHLPVRVVGRGSNLLVRDGGIPGVVVHPVKGEFGEVRIREARIEAGAGVRLKTLAAMAKNAGLGGFEWMEGIPGNVGGALRMNAGAMGVETFDQVVSVKAFDWETGEIRERRREEFAYRYRNVPDLEENFALSAVFEGRPEAVEAIASRLETSKQKRRASQPAAASAGCIFKNPESIPAGRLVEELGLKNAVRGGARVSEVHGNFIVNDGGATAEDVLGLIETIRERAWRDRALRLETEVQVIGEELPEADHFVRA